MVVDRRVRSCAAAIAVTVALVLAATSGGAPAAASPPSATPAPKRPNVVFILTDDLSWDLVNAQIAPHIVQLEQQGETFDHYFVADSLCCPSRSSIFTGLFPHDTHVQTNLAPSGGFGKFQSEHLDRRTYPVALHAAGYSTSMLGKYLNGYGGLGAKGPMTTANAPIPPGWTDWHVSNGTGYREFDFYLNDNGAFDLYSGTGKYGVDVLNSYAQSFIRAHAGSPFALEVATFAPHAPYTPAPRNANDFPGLTAPRDPSFDAANVDPPAWLAGQPPLGPRRTAVIDGSFRLRAQAVESVDKLLADTEATLAAKHLTDDTYIVFSSDNGYHLGQHRLPRGKQTAFDSDIRVPLIVAGPGVPHGRVVHQVVQNVDLYPTFVALAGARPASPVEGQSLVPLLHPSGPMPTWRHAALVEHLRQVRNNPADPDAEGGKSPTTYEAIRVSAARLPHFPGPVEGVYVEYRDSQHELEYYDLSQDPYELRNVASRLTEAQHTLLHKALVALERCHTASACKKAALPA